MPSVTDVGIVVGGDLRAVGELARLAEESGYESAWVTETTHTPFVQAALAIEATRSVRIGTAIALAFPRSPTITAMTARDLAELSDSRFILGLGSQVKRVNVQRFGVPFEHPAPKMAEYAEVVRSVLRTYRGEDVDHRGRFYEITMNPFPGAEAVGDVPLYLAAVGERMAETAGRSFDGVLGHPMTSPRYVAEVLRPAVERGARAAGRPPRSVNITTSVLVEVGDDREGARRRAAYQIAFYATTRTYRPVLALHGFDDRIDDLRAAYSRGDHERMADIAMPMVDVFAIAGTGDECLAGLEAFDGLADRVILGPSWVGPDAQRSGDSARRIVTRLRPRG